MARSYISTTRYVRIGPEWPGQQLAFWTIVMLAAAGTIMGVFASFITTQDRMRQGIPWIFPYGVTVGALTILFILIELYLLGMGKLQPGFMILISFILLVLFLTGLIETAIQLFGPTNVSGNCSRINDIATSGTSEHTLAWLMLSNICSSWYAAFSFWLIGAVFFIWMMIMGVQVASGLYDTPLRGRV